jgi:soluble lytic murein transglycosylase-like protein
LGQARGLALAIGVAGALIWAGKSTATAAPRGAQPAAAALAAPLARCRGSTRAQVAITWPSAAELASDRKLPWGAHVPWHIRRWAYLILPAARAVGVDAYLVAAVMHVESDGDPLAWNLDSDAHGLMQVLHASWEPTSNVAVGVAMLGDLQRQFHERDLVLAGYNAGPGNVRYYGGVPPFTETRDYIVLVDYYRDLYAGAPLSATRVARFKQAAADLVSFKHRMCG